MDGQVAIVVLAAGRYSCIDVYGSTGRYELWHISQYIIYFNDYVGQNLLTMKI